MAIFGLKSYFLSVENWLSLSLASMGMLTFCAKTGLVLEETFPSEKQILILASGNILAFLVVMLHCNRHPLLSVYTTRWPTSCFLKENIFLRTFAVIAAKYFTVLLFYFPIFLAFAINFRVLLTLSEASSESRQFWNSSMISIFRTFTMLTDPDPGMLDFWAFQICFRWYFSGISRHKLFFDTNLWFFNLHDILLFHLCRLYQPPKCLCCRKCHKNRRLFAFWEFYPQIFLAKAENWKRVSKIETVLFFERCTQTVLRAFGKFGERLWRKSFVCSKQTENTRQCKPNSYRKFQNAKIKSQSSVVQLLTWCEKKTPGTYLELYFII